MERPSWSARRPSFDTRGWLRDTWRSESLSHKAKTSAASLFTFVRDLDGDEGDAGTCYPSIPTLAATAMVSENTMRDGLRELKRDGWLTWDRPRGGHRSTTWRLLSGSSRGSGGEPLRHPGVQELSSRGSGAEPKHKKNKTKPLDLTAGGSSERVTVAGYEQACLSCGTAFTATDEDTVYCQTCTDVDDVGGV